MNVFFFARLQMAMSLAFHIVFATLGIRMPLLMVISEVLHLHTRQFRMMTGAQSTMRFAFRRA
jgi:cytochrome bd ubiquinol oxidase subunit I